MNINEIFQQDDPIAMLRQRIKGYNLLQKQELYWEMEAVRLDDANQIDGTLIPGMKSLLGKIEEHGVERFQTLFWQALMREDPELALRQTVIGLRTEGVSKGMLLSQLEVLRKQVGKEPEENIISTVMDSLVGWCRPHMKIT